MTKKVSPALHILSPETLFK